MKIRGFGATKSKSASPFGLTPVLLVSANLDFTLDLVQGLNARGAKLLRHRPAILEDLNLLHVDRPLRAGRLLRPGTVVAELRAFAAVFALSHELHSQIKNRSRARFVRECPNADTRKWVSTGP